MDLSTYLEEFTHRDWQTQSEGSVRVAVVGLGHWATEKAIPALQSATLCEPTVIISSSIEKAKRVGAGADIDTVLTYEAYKNGQSSAAYDAVYICTPNATHLEHAKTAATLGKDILCEKPLEATRERAEQLVDACRKSDVRLMVAYRMHTEPTTRRARELIQNGAIGEPLQVYGSNSILLLEKRPDKNQWRLNQDLSGYGTSVNDLGIYPLNTTRFLLETDPVEVHAFTRSASDEFADVPDEQSAFSIRFEDETLGVFTASQNAYSDSQLKITGTDGQIDLRPVFHMWVELTVERNGNTAEFSNRWVDEMKEEFDYFADHLLSGEDVTPNGTHGLIDMRTMEAIYESAKKGTRVRVPYP